VNTPSFAISEKQLECINGQLLTMDDSNQVTAALRPFASLGEIHLRVAQANQPLLQSCRSLFRKFDCLISFDTVPDVDIVCRWLDAGARELVLIGSQDIPVDTAQRLPENRWRRMEIAQELSSEIRRLVPAASIPSLDAFVDAFCQQIKSDRPDQLWPTIVCDPFGVALGLAYSNPDSLHRAVESGKGVYWSRSRNEIWEKGLTSGATSELVRIDLDCDRDALRFLTRQQPPGFCHLQTRTCFGEFDDLPALYDWIRQRSRRASGYTARLLRDPDLLRSKLTEEAGELADAEQIDDVVWEAADTLYFSMVAMIRAGVTMDQIVRELNRRTGQLIRRKGDAKPPTKRTD